MNKWHDIWNNKPLVSEETRDEFERFCELKKANGFDVAVEDAEAYYRGFYTEWLSFYEEVMTLAKGSIKGVYEVGLSLIHI